MPRQRAQPHVESLLTAPTLLAVGIDPIKGKVYLMARNGGGAMIKRELPLSPQIQATFAAARSLLL